MISDWSDPNKSEKKNQSNLIHSENRESLLMEQLGNVKNLRTDETLEEEEEYTTTEESMSEDEEVGFPEGCEQEATLTTIGWYEDNLAMKLPVHQFAFLQNLQNIGKIHPCCAPVYPGCIPENPMKYHWGTHRCTHFPNKVFFMTDEEFKEEKAANMISLANCFLTTDFFEISLGAILIKERPALVYRLLQSHGQVVANRMSRCRAMMSAKRNLPPAGPWEVMGCMSREGWYRMVLKAACMFIPVYRAADFLSLCVQAKLLDPSLWSAESPAVCMKGIFQVPWNYLMVVEEWKKLVRSSHIPSSTHK